MAELSNRTKAQVSQDALKLLTYVERNTGRRLTFEDIEKDTGVPMDDRGKNKLRWAVQKAGLEWFPEIGVGIELLNVTNALPITSLHTKRADGKVRRAKSAARTVLSRVGSELPTEKRQQVEYLYSCVSAAELAIELSHKVYEKPRPTLTLSPSKIEILT